MEREREGGGEISGCKKINKKMKETGQNSNYPITRSAREHADQNINDITNGRQAETMCGIWMKELEWTVTTQGIGHNS